MAIGDMLHELLEAVRENPYDDVTAGKLRDEIRKLQEERDALRAKVDFLYRIGLQEDADERDRLQRQVEEMRKALEHRAEFCLYEYCRISAQDLLARLDKERP